MTMKLALIVLILVALLGIAVHSGARLLKLPQRGWGRSFASLLLLCVATALALRSGGPSYLCWLLSLVLGALVFRLTMRASAPQALLMGTLGSMLVVFGGLSATIMAQQLGMVTNWV